MSTAIKQSLSSNLPPNEVDKDYREFKRGEIYYVELPDVGYSASHITNKTRPALIIQNNIGNAVSETLIVALLTTSYKKDYPFQYKLILNKRESIVMFEQIMTIDKKYVKGKVGQLTEQQIRESDLRLMYSLGIENYSFGNLIDFNIISVTTRKTLYKTSISFEFSFVFKNSDTKIASISIETLQQYDSSITSETKFEDLKNMFDCCKGLHWIFNNISI